MSRIHKPDVVVMDTALGDHNGLQTTATLHQQKRPRIPVILLSMNGNGTEAQRALQASATGYLLMNSKPEELSEAITKVLTGQKYVGSNVENHR